MQTLKQIYCPKNRAVMMFLYTNIRADPEDDKYILRQRKRAEQSISRFYHSERVRLAGLLWSNFDRGAWWCTFTFREEKLPADLRRARDRWAYFLRCLKRQGYPCIRYLRVIEHRHGEGRYHYHAVMDGAPRRVLSATWRRLYGDSVRIKRFNPAYVWANAVEGRGGLAEYLSKEGGPRQLSRDTLGRHCYSRSRGAAALADPEMIPAKPMPDTFSLSPPPGVEPDELRLVECNQYGQSSCLVYRKRQGGQEDLAGNPCL